MPYPFHINRAKIYATGTSGTATELIGAQYADRLIKLVPSEILSLYFTIRGLWASPVDPTSRSRPSNPEGFLFWWPLVCLILLVIVRLWGTRSVTNWKTTQPGAVAISAISFIIWIYTIGDSILGLIIQDTRYAATLGILWIFLLPVFFPYLVTDSAGKATPTP